MTSPFLTTAEVNALAMAGQENFVPAAEELRPHSFLTLAPKTSASYPAAPMPQSETLNQQVESPTAADTKEVSELSELDREMLLKATRSESMSSDASSVGAQKTSGRFLKLGPVHGGENDGKGDWSEQVVAE
ncbi:hypothetical protein CJF32_00005774 [Rutstroemia sp. NJR-2017a WRK4]|nr:hypothetical protein CJF32_00005774 [Rutstroemia sp. NJR-2017a WRK4]